MESNARHTGVVRVAIAHSFYRAAMPSGENNAVLMQAEALERAGHVVDLVSVQTDEAICSPTFHLRAGFRVVTNHGANPGRQVRAFRPDIVHIHNLFPNWTSGWIQACSAPVVATFHNYRTFCAAGTFMRDGSHCTLCPTLGSHNAVRYACYGGSRTSSIPLALATRRGTRKRVISDIDAAVFLSDSSKRTHERFTNLPAHAPVIPNFVKPGSGATTIKKQAKRTHWAYVGRLTPEKGILELIRHWPSGENLLVVGSGPLEREAQSLADPTEITFVGQLESDETRRIIAGSRGLIFPSQAPEPAPSLAYLEALSVGVPTITLRGSGTSDDVEAHRTGVAFDGFDSLALSMNLVREHWRQLSTNATARFDAAFTENAWLTAIETLYGEVRADFQAR